MTWSVVFEKASGKMVSEGDVVADDTELNTRGYAKLEVGSQPDWSVNAWDQGSRAIVARGAAPKIEQETRLPTLYERWAMWKATRVEATTRAAPAALITALQNREDAAWTNYLTALQAWQTAP